MASVNILEVDLEQKVFLILPNILYEEIARESESNRFSSLLNPIMSSSADLIVKTHLMVIIVEEH